jgi:T4 beta protein
MDAPIYVPVVKAKRNDIASLDGVVPSNRLAIRPLLELAEYGSTDCDKILGALVTRLARFTWPNAPYVDLYSFLPDACVASGVNATVEGFRRIADSGISVIPTYGFERNDNLWGDLGAVAERLATGFCFRVDIEDLDDQSEQTWVNIIERSAEMGLAAGDIDVIVDLRFVGDWALQQLTDLTHEFLELQPEEFRPRFRAVAGSSALKNVAGIPVNGTGTVVRQELLLWSEIQALLGAADQVAYGDYGVIHPDFSQSAPSPNANAKIRYTRGDSIHYFRGTRLFKPANFGQYHSLARRVIASPHYRGLQYSAGDGEIWNCANRNTQPGNLGTWVKVDQNHHIETTVDQIRHALLAVANGAAASRVVEVLQGA